MNNYSVVGILKVEKTELLSVTSIELKEFILSNGLSSVSTFLEYIDNNSFANSTYYDVLLEAKGLADLIKLKYFNIPLEMGTYLDKTIKYIEFDEKNIHSLIHRLGFSNKERNIIFNVSVSTDNMLLIDLLYDTYKRILNDRNEINVILCNKIILILNYYLKTKTQDNKSNFIVEFNKELEVFGDILAKNYFLKSQVNKNEKKLPPSYNRTKR